nr:protein LTO1 homolog isoform X1 [Kogia breviceps]XP_058924633.1 protein LTO1 homolog isoform X1 [Kogia breviceps]
MESPVHVAEFLVFLKHLTKQCSLQTQNWGSMTWLQTNYRGDFAKQIPGPYSRLTEYEGFHGEGYQKGYEEGSSLGMIEGRQYGTLHGAKIGSEIGCYQGFAFAWRCLLHGCATEKDSKKMKVLESLIRMIQKFPYDDPTYDKLHEDLDRIRGKFKQLCSLLNVQPDFKISAGDSGLSF